jgi:hypothetical protein
VPPGKSVDSGASTEISARQLTAWYPEYTFEYPKDTGRGDNPLTDSCENSRPGSGNVTIGMIAGRL